MADYYDIPTVKIKNGDSDSGYAIINESDFNEETDELFEGEGATDLSKMTKALLLEYAEANGIEVDATAKKADILAAIEQAS